MRFLPYRLPAAAFGGVCKSGPPRKGLLPPCGETGDAERRNEGRIIVFHADAEDFLGSAAGREPREQQREEEPSQKNGPE